MPAELRPIRFGIGRDAGDEQKKLSISLLSAHDGLCWGMGVVENRPGHSSRSRETEDEHEELDVQVRWWKRLVGMALLVTLTACATPEPVLRSNKHLQLYGRQMAQQEIEACRKTTEATGLRPGVHQSGNAASGAALGLTLGGAVGASAGIIGGLPGMTIGAAAGAGLGMIIGLVGGSYMYLEPDPPYAAAMVRCLTEKGYDVKGWQ